MEYCQVPLVSSTAVIAIDSTAPSASVMEPSATMAAMLSPAESKSSSSIAVSVGDAPVSNIGAAFSLSRAIGNTASAGSPRPTWLPSNNSDASATVLSPAVVTVSAAISCAASESELSPIVPAPARETNNVPACSSTPPTVLVDSISSTPQMILPPALMSPASTRVLPENGVPAAGSSGAQ